MFSTAVKLANLDDYLESSQDCIVSLLSDKDDSKPRIAVMRPAKTEHKESGNKSENTEKATVNLADCLACSGCVTSAETKLLQDQNVTRFMDQIKQKKMTVISISNQSCSSFANQLNCDLNTIQRKFSGLFKHIGAKFVMNSTISEYISLLETKYEFISRYKKNSNLPMIISHCPGWVFYSEKSLDNSVIPLLSRVRSAQQLQGILIKTLTLEIYNQLLFLYKFRLINPYRIRSIKYTFTKYDEFVDQKDIFHVAIMPCHDKKLESTRSSLSIKSLDENSTFPEVDIVLATSEVEELINLAGFNSLLDVPEAPLDNLWLNQSFQITSKNDLSLLITENNTNNQILNQFCWLIPSYYNSNSGGFCEYIIRSAIKELSGEDIDKRIKLPFKKLINDTFEAEYKENNVKLRYCLAYGFRAIQSISRKLNLQKNASQHIQSIGGMSNDVSYHLIEAMACPSGCISGGGQILLKNNGKDDSSFEVENIRKNIKFIDGVQETFYKGIELNSNRDIILPNEIPIVNILYDYLIKIDKQIDTSFDPKLPFLRNDFVSIGEIPTASSLKW
ncbi:NARF-like protein nuclear prelamin A recognition factor [Cryptosporidium ubiquitum]|uniref:NARF-like protein nuclear prelamin A recognition factor n=1 Tax=Cryptosporidium ubiquitum TaxID=857276 RepID=A0A1J4MJT4_9CRYT|nr:NARF-like protein nuclear prelamin A recognition factor [Cryptosporidium ubiquitum]OII74462.1 NARF-like protein nuclear prelamin A recognition factor [Cryptosporidium ubiquitum]